MIDALEQAKDGKTRVTYDVWEGNKYPRSRRETSRLCSDTIALLKEHVASFKGSHDGAGRGNAWCAATDATGSVHCVQVNLECV